MKKTFLAFGFIFSVVFAAHLEAKMRSETFNSGETLTAGKLFLNQVDTVSLYLSTDRVVYVPHLSKEMHLSVALTLLGTSFGADQNALQEFVTRHINTFNKTLMERLQYYTPSLAKEFDPEKDVDFSVRMGADKTTVATWSEGQWHWVKVPTGVEKGTAVKAAPVSAVPAEENVPSKKRCPALIGHKEEVAEPQVSEKVSEVVPPQAKEPTSEPQEIASELKPTVKLERAGVGQ